jgi:hypothetical protein
MRNGMGNGIGEGARGGLGGSIWLTGGDWEGYRLDGRLTPARPAAPALYVTSMSRQSTKGDPSASSKRQESVRQSLPEAKDK